MSHRKKRPVEVNQWGIMGNQLSVVSYHLSVIIYQLLENSEVSKWLASEKGRKATKSLASSEYY